MSTINERLDQFIEYAQKTRKYADVGFYTDCKAEFERLQARVAEKCDAPVGWIAPDKYKAACESKMEFFKTIKELREQNEKFQARVVSLECRLWEAEDPTNPDAFILRKQAEAVEECAAAIAAYHPLHPFGDFDDYVVAGMKAVYDFVVLKAQHLRNEAAKAGGDDE